MRGPIRPLIGRSDGRLLYDTVHRFIRPCYEGVIPGEGDGYKSPTNINTLTLLYTPIYPFIPLRAPESGVSLHHRCQTLPSIKPINVDRH